MEVLSLTLALDGGGRDTCDGYESSSDESSELHVECVIDGVGQRGDGVSLMGMGGENVDLNRSLYIHREIANL